MIDQLKTNNDFFGQRPEVEAHSFAITHLSMSPDGFLLETDRTIPKVEDLHLDESEKALMGEGVKREMAFNGVEALRAARRIWKDEPDNVELEAAFYETRADYQKKGKKIGLRNIHVEDDVIHADVQVVHFPNYTLFGQPDQSEAIERISRLVGASMIVRTADSRLIIQHRAAEKQHLRKEGRTRGNAVYSDIPGASVAGMFDASFESPDRRPGQPDSVDTDSVLGTIYKEGGEELGLAPSDFKAVRITGLAEDKIKVHDEFLLLADSPMTAAEIRQTSRLSSRNKNLGDADFEEKFFDIDASSAALNRLLTDVKCPLPPTHAAALVAAGFSLALEEGGADYALAWRDQIEQGLRDNYDAMDTMVKGYYERFPDAVNQVPERYWGRRDVPPRNPMGYDPAYTPEEQGLPSFEDEMVRTELLLETRETVKKAELFDVDGPLSDPVERRVVEPELMTEITARLKAGMPVALNSGRSVRWMEDNVIGLINDQIGDDVGLLERFIVVGEKGGAWLTFDAEGKPFHGEVKGISVSDELRERIHALVKEKYSDSVADVDPKKTMVSLEMKPGYDLAAFTALQPQLVADLKVLLVELGADQTFVVDPTTIAVDIESPYVGKQIGADRFLQHLDDLNLKVGEFEAFGDSPSDAAMTDELVRRGHQARLIYVGNDHVESKEYPVSNIGNFSQGTLDYLRDQDRP